MHNQQLDEGELKEMLMHQEKSDDLGLLTSHVAVVLLDGLCDQVPSARTPAYQHIQSDHLIDIDLLSHVNLHERLLFLQSTLQRESDTQATGVVAADCNRKD